MMKKLFLLMAVITSSVQAAEYKLVVRAYLPDKDDRCKIRMTINRGDERETKNTSIFGDMFKDGVGELMIDDCDSVSISLTTPSGGSAELFKAVSVKEVDGHLVTEWKRVDSTNRTDDTIYLRGR